MNERGKRQQSRSRGRGENWTQKRKHEWEGGEVKPWNTCIKNTRGFNFERSWKDFCWYFHSEIVCLICSRKAEEIVLKCIIGVSVRCCLSNCGIVPKSLIVVNCLIETATWFPWYSPHINESFHNSEFNTMAFTHCSSFKDNSLSDIKRTKDIFLKAMFQCYLVEKLMLETNSL